MSFSSILKGCNWLIGALSLTLGYSSTAWSLVILQYHRVSDEGPKSTRVSPRRFEEHLQLIENLNLQVVDLEEALNRLQSGNPMESAVAITFDDGYANIYTEAYPALKKRSWPFTLFISTQAIDRNFGEMLSWQQIKEMDKHGALIANHSHDHAYLVRPPLVDSQTYESDILTNLDQTQKRLEQIIGRSLPKLFAYPYGEYNLRLMNLLHKKGWTAFGQQSGPVGTTSNWSALPRFPASGVYSDLNSLKTKLLSLPFEVLSEKPVSPEIPNQRQYQLEVTYGQFDAKTLKCYFQGSPIDFQSSIETDQLKLLIQLPSPMPMGRSRINCTARHQSEHRFFWYSKFWLNTDRLVSEIEDEGIQNKNTFYSFFEYLGDRLNTLSKGH